MRQAKAATTIRRQPSYHRERGRCAAQTWPVSDPHLWTPQHDQGVVPPQPWQRRLGPGTRAIWRAQNAQRDLERGRGFDAIFESLDIATVVREWERGDEIVWSLIISPEDAERLDLRQHARDFVAGMERDLGTNLEWIAIDHHNTDDAHIHLLIRGVREDGKVLTLDREYIRRGLRELSQELIERKLGPRLEHEVLLARERTIEREQWTEIDRALERRGGRRSGGQLRALRTSQRGRES